MRGAEAFDLLQALNTGHLGSMSTIHANSGEQALTRLAHCVLTANVGLPHRSIREAIALAIHVVAHVSRVDGRRRVTELLRVAATMRATDRFLLSPLLVEAPQVSGSGTMTQRIRGDVVVACVLGRLCGVWRTGTFADRPFTGALISGGDVDRHDNALSARGRQTSGPVSWTFAVVDGTDLRTFRVTIQSQHTWLPITTTVTSAIEPTNQPPARISTQGDYASPRGCTGSFLSVGTADTTTINADLTGIDCLSPSGSTFTGRFALTKGR